VESELGLALDDQHVTPCDREEVGRRHAGDPTAYHDRVGVPRQWGVGHGPEVTAASIRCSG
jgi:hypothetical protein